MAGLAPIVTKKEFKNWVKGSLAVLFTKDGLTDFVSAEVDQHHHRLLQLVTTATMTNTCNCTINSLPQCTRSKNHRHIVSGKQLCSRGVCNILMDKICEDHRFKGPSWKNTDPQKWCTDAFEVAKCFMPPDGYSDKTSLPETDFNGILAVIINNRSFTTLIQANLETEPNICTKARKVGREIRHTKDYLLSDTDLKDFIDDLINLLSDPAGLQKDSSAKDAITKLRMLKANDLTIHDKDVTEALRDNIRETLSEEHRDILHKINEHFSQHQTDSVAVIDRIVADRKRELEELANKLTDNITRHAELKKLEIEQYGRTKEKKDNEENLKVLDFQSDLIDFYRKYNSEMPLSLLVKRNAVPLLELYVKPPMSAIDLNQWLGDSLGNPIKTDVNNYQELFFFKDQAAFKDVYVTAETGVGKTALCNHICLTWCQAHTMILPQSFVLEDVNAMKCFDFLFLISLRNVNVSQCDIDDFIRDNIHKLRKSTERCKYVEHILDNKSCLIVLDGLDEWVHPTDCQKPGHEIDIPHSKYRPNCTIMTTTRPWKFDKLSLPSSKVDRHIEIKDLDDNLSKQLATNAIKLLSDRSSRNKAPKSVADFYDATACLKLNDLRVIPYIHLHTVLLWHDDKSIGRSKSEIFKNILMYILERGIKQLNLDSSPAMQQLKSSIKNWLENETEFPQNSDFLRCLGKLAFYTLLGLELSPVQTLARSKKYEALNYIESEEDLELYFKFGLLSQNESFESVSLPQSNISFQHKTLQEYFSAMYIYHDSENEDTYRLFRNKCSSIQSILEMCNVFTFLSGFNPRLYTSTLSNILSGPPTESSGMASVKVDCVLSSDAVVKKFRNGSCLYFMHDRYTYDVMFAFQTMQADCMHEIEVNGQHDCFPHIEDIIINKTSKTEKYISLMENMIQNNQSNIKTLSVQQVNIEQCEKLLKSLKIHLLQSLEMLQFWTVVEQKDLEKILGRNSKTLKSVDISNVTFENNKHIPKNTPLSEECLNAITNMPNLKIISLEQISLTHRELESMVDFVSNRTELTHIEMMHIRCRHDPRNTTCGVRLNLSRHEHLLGLCLHFVNINELYVNTEKLEVFMIGKLLKGTTSACLKQIPSNPLIHTLSCRTMEDTDLSTFLEVIKNCWKLQKIYFYGTYFGERGLDLSIMHANLEFVDIHKSDISCSALFRLTNSVGLMTQTVNITLDGCTVSPKEEYEKFKEEIRENKKFRVQFDGYKKQNREEFRFQKIEC